jgi:hypothetical protein
MKDDLDQDMIEVLTSLCAAVRATLCPEQGEEGDGGHRG